MIKVVKFGAQWCTSCKQLDVLLASYGDKISVDSLDVETHAIEARNHAVRSLPTVLLYKDSELYKTVAGAHVLAHTAEHIKELLDAS
ncbi:thioredoxin [Xanthomonas phage DES1]|nr:thioredoxin [Xanthomonas phage DES1]